MFRAMSEFDIKFGLKTVLKRIKEASEKRSTEFQFATPRLVAVSKTKPVCAIIDAYEAGQRHFGENYVQELVDKATNEEILSKCKDIKWHFIGNLQTNKVNKILSFPNLYMVETVNSEKLATKLNSGWAKTEATDDPLHVMIQVNTSREEAKSGVTPLEAVTLAEHIVKNCANLKLDGIMTIGLFGYDLTQGPNPDFICLRQCRTAICQHLQIEEKSFDLSMGMSDDFEHAIEMGSTNVRVGSAIFGIRSKTT